MKLSIFDQQFKKTSKEFKIATSKAVNQSMLWQYLQAFNANQRKARAVIKTKAEVRGGGKKPWKQKGTGKARAGSSRSPIWVGGGRAHGPRNRNYKKSLSKSLKSSLFNQVFYSKMSDGSLVIVDFKDTKVPSTSNFIEILQKVSTKPSLKTLVVSNNEPYIVKSAQNLQNVVTRSVFEVNTVDMAKAQQIIISKKASEVLL